MIKCPFCDFKYHEASELEKHLQTEHFLSMQSFYEMKPLKDEEVKCYKCGEYRPPLVYVQPGGCYLPCWDCVKNRYERNQSVAMIHSALKDFFVQLVTDRYLQMFLITDTYFNNTLSHTYQEFKDVLKELQSSHSLGRNKVWFLDWNIGFPRLICESNLLGIKVVDVDSLYKIENEKTYININSWQVKFPEFIPFDKRHHSRHNILNTSEDTRRSKRLRMGEDQCIKFYSNPGNNSKTIFTIEDRETGKIISPTSLSPLDLIVTKLILLRNKSFTRLISSIIEEIIPSLQVYSDSALLRNTVLVNPEESKKVNLSWLPELHRDSSFINISIL